MASKYGIIGVVMTVLIGIILVGSVLAPTIDDIQRTAGDEITISNDYDNSLKGDYYNEDVTIVISSDNTATSVADATFTINGTEYTNPSTGQKPIAFGDGFRLAVNGGSSASMGTIRGVDGDGNAVTTSLALGRTLTMTYTATTGEVVMTLVATSDPDTVLNTYTFTTTTLFAWKNDGNYVYYSSGSFTDVAITELRMANKTAGVFWYMNLSGVTVGEETIPYDVYVCTSGENIRPTSTTNYTLSASITVDDLELYDGTTDIYTGGTPVLTVTFKDTNGDVALAQDVTPSESFVYVEAVGHEASGTEYALYGAVLVVAIVAVALVGFRSFLGNRD